MTGGKSSKSIRGDGPPLPIDDAQSAADFSSYEAACRSDPGLRPIDETIHECTRRVLESLPNGVEAGSLTLGLLREITGSLLDINIAAVGQILQYPEDIRKNKDMLNLVQDYFDHSQKSMDFFNALEGCLRKTRECLLSVRVAVAHFEGEEGKGADANYEKTLKELRAFTKAKDPFSDEFLNLFIPLYERQLAMFNRLQIQKRKLDKRLKSLKTWRKVSNVIFVAAFASVFIVSVVAAALTLPPVVTGVAAAASASIGGVWKWCNTLWSKHSNEVKGQAELINSVQGQTCIVLGYLTNFKVVVCRFEIMIDSLIKTADIALRDQSALKIGMDEIRKNLEAFTDTIDNVREHAEKCSRDTAKARTVVLHKITGNTGS